MADTVGNGRNARQPGGTPRYVPFGTFTRLEGHAEWPYECSVYELEGSLMAIDLTPYSELLLSALADGTPCTVATVSEDGMPDIGLKGSLMVYDADHLAYWERARRRHMANLKTGSPGVAAIYYSREKRRHVRFFGEAELHEEGPVRDAIMARTIQAELDRDPERMGAGVLIRVDRIEDPASGGTILRD